MSKTSSITYRSIVLLAFGCLSIVWFAGCHNRQRVNLGAQCAPTQTFLQQIEYPDVNACDDSDGTELMSAPPVTLSSFEEMPKFEMTIDECVQMALANSQVMQKLGGVVVRSPQGATTLFDQAIFETSPLQSPEAALSAFDAQVNSGLFFNHREAPSVGATALFGSSITDTATYNFNLSKQTATGATISLKNQTDYSRSKIQPSFQPFRSTWDTANTVELRQPLMRNAGTSITRIAGPNAVPGQYNGVLIARIRSDISLADFEAAVRDLVRDVETNYWELYYSYRDLATKLSGRDSARATWENRKLRYDNGIERPDNEAQARQQYFSFESQVQNALIGSTNGAPGVMGSERNLRRLLGLPVNDGRIIRPSSEPLTAPVVFDWNESQVQTLGRRVEARRQKWTIRQRELELIAARQLNQWKFDLVGSYGFKGFGDNLFGSRTRANGSAYDDMINGDLDDWQLGVEYGGPIGNRQGHLAIRNAELNLRRERAVLKEQQRQLLHDLGAAFAEVDRAFVSMKTSFNQRVAVQDELEPKRKRADVGQDQVFFLLDVQQRAATAESGVHRSIATYNQALMNYAYATGSLLARYNIQLTEGPWSEDAAIRSSVKAGRMGSSSAPVLANRPVSIGAFDQQKPGVATSQ